ncbi:MAG: sodium ion-translocating decarboxylase subunit beta [Lachnospiraceae bacterium]|nr:sodium ion-translocating decarboxylase subunit beta [Lachnospiraceae bacterium]
MTLQQIIMYGIGIFLIVLAIKKRYEPELLLPMGFGAILVNLPSSGVINQHINGIGEVQGIIEWLYQVGIASSEVLPILLFIGIGAMIDFAPLIARPIFFVFGLAAQLGIFVAILVALALGFDVKDAFSIGMIGAADGPTSILVSQVLRSDYVGAIAVAAYSYMALVPMIQPITIKCITTKKERQITMCYAHKEVSRRAKIIFPIIITVIAGLIAPMSLSLIGFLMFGNLIRECGVLDKMSHTAQDILTNVVTLLLGITISFSMRAELFVQKETLLIMLIGLLAFVFDTIGGVFVAKFLNIFLKSKINPMIGAAGISAFPMSSRVVQKIAQEELPGNIILMQAVSANVAGQIGSVLVGGLLLHLFSLWA